MGESQPTNPGHCIDFLNRNTNQVLDCIQEFENTFDANLPVIAAKPSNTYLRPMLEARYRIIANSPFW